MGWFANKLSFHLTGEIVSGKKKRNYYWRCFFQLATGTLCLLLIPVAAISSSKPIDVFVDEKLTHQVEESAFLNIAVLPVENFTVDPRVSVELRKRIIDRLKVKGYAVLASELVDENLNRLGLSHAGQLGLLSFEELAEAVHADLFLSGVVEQAAQQHAGVYNAYVYSCSLKLQDASGQLLWSALQGRFAKRRFAVDPVNALLDIFLVKKGGPADDAMHALADMLLAELPDGPAKVIIGDSLLEQAQTIEAFSHD